MKTLTKRQEAIRKYIEDFIGQRGYSPTFREIGRHFGIKVRGSYDHLKALRRKGVVTWEPGVSRTIRLVEK